MNYFGLFFTFMVPGLVLGAMAVFAAQESKSRHKARRAAQSQARPCQGKLYVYDLRQDRAA